MYTHGLSAYLHFGVAASSGILAALLVLTKGFVRLGNSNGAITIPDWIYQRYQSRRLSLFFAFINLLSITFVVLILVGCSMLVSAMFPVSQQTGLLLVLLFVFSYVLMGGTYAHAYTNAVQGVMMLLIAAILAIGGLHYFDGGFVHSLERIGAEYASVYNSNSELYNSFFSVFAGGFLVTFALTLQLHILSKLLYLKRDGDSWRFIGTATVVGLVYSQMLLVGFYARLAGVDAPAQDAVLVTYLEFEYAASQWGQYLLPFVFVSLLAAGMSTLDGILVSLSAMVVNDIYRPLRPHGSEHSGLWLSRWVLVAVGCIAAVLAWNPPPLVGLFAQTGVYGLAAALLVPILFGVLMRTTPPLWLVSIAALTGLGAHLVLNLLLGITNPAVSASVAILCSLGLAAGGLIAIKSVRKFSSGY